MYNFNLNDPKFLPHAGASLGFCLKKSSALVITGNNGVGKSTLMRRFYQDFSALSVLIDQTSLDFFYDRPLKKVKEIFLSSRRNAIDEELFFRLWDIFGLSQKEERSQSTLSGGEGQLLKLVLGLTIHSEIILLDEPSHYLDEKMKRTLNEILNDLLGSGKTLLMIEHDLSWVKFPYEGIHLEERDQQLKVVKTWTT